MALIPEDGTGVPGADSYVTLVEANTYWTAHGSPTSWTGASDAGKESALRHATRWVDEEYAGRWKGALTYVDTQELRWPRTGVYDDERRLIATNEIPRVLKEAVFQAAKLHLEGGGLAAVTKDGIKREELVDVVEREFFSYSGSTSHNDFIGSLLSGLLAVPAGLLVAVRG